MKLSANSSFEEEAILGIFQVKYPEKEEQSEESKLFCHTRNVNTNIHIYRYQGSIFP